MDETPRHSNFLRLVLLNPVFANILMIMIFACGLLGLFSMVRESFPQFELDFITISVAYPGADPVEIEESICRQLEDALEGISGIKRVISVAEENVGLATVELNENADKEKVRTEIENNVDAIDNFPVDSEQPVIETFQFDDAVINIAIWGDQSERRLKELGRELRDELLLLPGISRVDVAGVRDYQVDIEISEARLQQYGLTFSEVAAAVGRSSENLPGGVLRTASEDFTIRVLGRRYFATEFGDLVVRASTDGTQVLLRDIAAVRDTFDEQSAVYGLYNGKRSVNLAVLKARDEDAIRIAEDVKEYVEIKRRQLPDTVTLSLWLDTSRLITGRIDLLKRNGTIGIILVFLVLWLFLELRLCFWVTLGLGMSVCGAFALMAMTGQSINMISLFGLIMVLGIIVDDAIVVGESIYSRRERGEPPFEAALEGTREVFWPVLTAVFTSMVAFLPLLFISSTIGKFIAVLPGPIIAALFISLFEALIILPVHLRHLPSPREAGSSTIAWYNIMGQLRRVSGFCMAYVDVRIYVPALRFLLRWRYATIAGGVAILMLAGSLIAGGVIKTDFFPAPDTDWIQAEYEFPGGTPIATTEAAAKAIIVGWNATDGHYSDRIGGKPLADSIYAVVGGTLGLETGTSKQSDHIGAVFIELLPTEERDIHFQKIVNRWRDSTGAISGAVSVKFKGLSGGPPGGDIQVAVLSPNEDDLVAAINELSDHLSEYDGVTQINSDYKPGKKEMRMRLKPTAQALGISLADIGQQIRAGFYGQEVSRVQRGPDEVKIMVRYTRDERRTLAQMNRLRIRTPAGDEVPLHHVAKVEFADGFASIRREQGQRKISITAETSDDVDSGVIMDGLVENYLPRLAEKYNVTAKRGTEAQDRVRSVDSIKRGGAVAILLIYLIMATVFKSYVQPVIIMFAIPFGIVGAIIGHLIYNVPMSMMSLFGMVALTGVVVNDAIILIIAINERLARGMPFFDAIVSGGKRRFRAIVLTSLTTFAGLFPMILEKSLQAQILIPMAIAIVFGVAFATIGTLIFIPCLLAVLNDLRCLAYWIWNLRLPETRETVEPNCNIGRL
jgi:multidrug efflux pump subunit AcrB